MLTSSPFVCSLSGTHLVVIINFVKLTQPSITLEESLRSLYTVCIVMVWRNVCVSLSCQVTGKICSLWVAPYPRHWILWFFVLDCGCDVTEAPLWLPQSQNCNLEWKQSPSPQSCFLSGYFIIETKMKLEHTFENVSIFSPSLISYQCFSWIFKVNTLSS